MRIAEQNHRVLVPRDQGNLWHGQAQLEKPAHRLMAQVVKVQPFNSGSLGRPVPRLPNRHGRHREYPLVGLGQRLKDGGCPGRQWDRPVLAILRVADRQLPSAQVQVALQDLQQFPAPHTRFDSQFDQGPEVGGLAGLGCVTEPVELTGSTMGSVVDAGQVTEMEI